MQLKEVGGEVRRTGLLSLFVTSANIGVDSLIILVMHFYTPKLRLSIRVLLRYTTSKLTNLLQFISN